MQLSLQIFLCHRHTWNLVLMNLVLEPSLLLPELVFCLKLNPERCVVASFIVQEVNQVILLSISHRVYES